ncbi:hypothetical protein AB0M22_18030 [Nocardia sp. NPDC051756]|uniref:hypothetical protein n=1 Tax=Nocardia sp. NPDC051756 TaxID=3154751 RepID=UPI0034239709
MSAVDERSALEHPVSLIEHIQRLRCRFPDGPLPEDDRVWDRAVALLLRMGSATGYRAEIDRYARQVFTLVAAETARMTPTSRRCADLAALVVDLRTGAAACLDWAEYERAAVLDRFLSVLRSQSWLRALESVPGCADPFVPRRNRWIRDVLDRGNEAIGRNRFEIHVVLPVAPGPAVYPVATTRILLAGRPIIAELFPHGVGERPEKLLHRTGLRATEQPRRVRLAACAEECCGALYVTIVREGGSVIWREWATPMSGHSPEFRFPAAEYDLEVAGAEHDDSWKWLVHPRPVRQPGVASEPKLARTFCGR